MHSLNTDIIKLKKGRLLLSENFIVGAETQYSGKYRNHFIVIVDLFNLSLVLTLV